MSHSGPTRCWRGCVNGCEQPALWRALTGGKGYAVASPRHAAVRDATKTQLALKIWQSARPAVGTIVQQYLAARGLPAAGAASPMLRFHPNCRHPTGVFLPAMVAAVTGPHGSLCAVHRTFLRADGSGKAAIDPSKASLGPMEAGAIRLDAGAVEIVVGEGIETTLAAAALTGLPAWCAISAGNLAHAMALPPDVHSVVIAVDRDEPGERAAKGAALRWRAEGRRVRLLLPDLPGQDANDVLRALDAVHG